MSLIHSFPPSAESLREACTLLMQGGILALATETVFGVVADAAHADAIAALYAAKGRAAHIPLQILVPDFTAAKALAEFNEQAQHLAARFWPGALTLVLPMRNPDQAMLAPNLFGGGNEIGLRVPDHPTAQALLRAYGKPLAASSANRSGQPPAHTAQETQRALGAIFVLDGDCSPTGPASSVIRCVEDRIEILRAGIVSAQIA